MQHHSLLIFSLVVTKASSSILLQKVATATALVVYSINVILKIDTTVHCYQNAAKRTVECTQYMKAAKSTLCMEQF